jgi:hypothetical protein
MPCKWHSYTAVAAAAAAAAAGLHLFLVLQLVLPLTRRTKHTCHDTYTASALKSACRCCEVGATCVGVTAAVCLQPQVRGSCKPGAASHAQDKTHMQWDLHNINTQVCMPLLYTWC